MLRLPWDVYLKGGKMFLPYGLQLQDDNAFIRGGRNGSVTTGFSFNEQPDRLRGRLGARAGGGGLRGLRRSRRATSDVQVTGTVYSLFTDVPVVRNVLLGGSFSHVAPPRRGDVRLRLLHRLQPRAASPTSARSTSATTRTRTTASPAPTSFAVASSTTAKATTCSSTGSISRWPSTTPTTTATSANASTTARTASASASSRSGASFLQTRLFYRVSNGIESNPSHNQDLWSPKCTCSSERMRRFASANEQSLFRSPAFCRNVFRVLRPGVREAQSVNPVTLGQRSSRARGGCSPRWMRLRCRRGRGARRETR